jgi:uncharacterized membrane protein YkvA (DUF1232 family)
MPKKSDMISSQNAGFFQDLVQRLKLLWRLMADRRVNFFLKLLPVASLVYLLSPIDLAPGITLPVIGMLDDAAIIWIGTSLFMSLCPVDVVQEHWDDLTKVISAKWRNAQEASNDAEIVEVTARDTESDRE